MISAHNSRLNRAACPHASRAPCRSNVRSPGLPTRGRPRPLGPASSPPVPRVRDRGGAERIRPAVHPRTSRHRLRRGLGLEVPCVPPSSRPSSVVGRTRDWGLECLGPAIFPLARSLAFPIRERRVPHVSNARSQVVCWKEAARVRMKRLRERGSRRIPDCLRAHGNRRGERWRRRISASRDGAGERGAYRSPSGVRHRYGRAWCRAS